MSITRLTHRYIAEHVSIKDCLRKGLINYSALSREICRHYGLDRFDAVLIACRRHYQKIKAQGTQEKRIIGLLKRARIQMKNKVVTIIIEKPRDFERLYQLQTEIKRDRGDFHLIEGEETVMIISNSDYIEEFRSTFRGKIVKLSLNLAQITMVFDEKIETTPGVVSFIYGLLADNEINVREEMSCWTDLIMILEETDAARAMRVLSLPDQPIKDTTP